MSGGRADETGVVGLLLLVNIIGLAGCERPDGVGASATFLAPRFARIRSLTSRTTSHSHAMHSMTVKPVTFESLVGIGPVLSDYRFSIVRLPAHTHTF